MTAHHGMKLDDAVRAAEALGSRVRRGKGGEAIIDLPNGKRLCCNMRKRDAPKELTKWLMRLQALQEVA